MKSKVLTITSLLLISYGYLARLSHIYFFWESKDIGWALFFITLTAWLIQRIKMKKSGQKRILEKIAIGICALVLIGQTILFFILLNYPATKEAKNYFLGNQQIIKEIGSIKGFSLTPQGSVSSSTNNTSQIGDAEIQLTLKGDLKYIDVSVHMVKTANSDWKVLEFKKEW